MSTASAVSSNSFRVHASRARPTEPPAGRQFRDALAHVATRVLRGVEGVAPLVPGGAVVGLASRAIPQGSGVTGSGGGAAGGDPGSALGGLGGGGLGGGANDTLTLLALQRDIGLEQQRYSALSNVLKARHETARAVIQNVR